jgi:soluble lytic murein transglycosylase-like protein
MRLFFLVAGIFVSRFAHGEIIKDCDLIRYAKEEGAINPRLVLAITDIESSKNSKVVSKQGRSIHYGLMQLKPATARLMGFRGDSADLLEWKTNVKYGVKYLNQKLKRYKSKQAAAAAYNAGAAFPCKTMQKCHLGEFANQRYVDLVMDRYQRKIKCGNVVASK